jgi:hypothetical protein
MTVTVDKPPETPVQPQSAAPLPSTPEKRSDPPRRLFWPQPKTIRHVVIEVLIVAIGVLLALGIDQWRQHLGRLSQAAETRRLLHNEMQRNLELVERGMRGISELYAMIESQPDMAPSIADGGGRGAPILFDAAFEVAMQTGAFAYLETAEQQMISEAYRSQKNQQENAQDSGAGGYWRELWELALFATDVPSSAEELRDQTRQLRRWQRAAGSMFVAQCRLMVRYRRALGVPAPAEGSNYCREADPATTDVEALIAGRGSGGAPVASPQPDASN